MTLAASMLGRFDEDLAMGRRAIDLVSTQCRQLGEPWRDQVFHGAARRSRSGFQEGARTEPRCCGRPLRVKPNLCDAGAASGCFTRNRAREERFKEAKITIKKITAGSPRDARVARPLPAGQLGPRALRQSWGFCVAVCVVTLVSLPGSSRVSPCRSGTREGQGRCVGPHGHCPRGVTRSLPVSFRSSPR